MAEKKTKEEVKELLKAKGVSLNVSGCGCCDSPWVALEIDGVLVVDEGFYNLDMEMSNG